MCPIIKNFARCSSPTTYIIRMSGGEESLACRSPQVFNRDWRLSISKIQGKCSTTDTISMYTCRQIMYTS